MRVWISLFLPLVLLSCTRAQKLNPAQLHVPDGFQIAVFAHVPHARMMTLSPAGALLVSDISDGKVIAFRDLKHPEKMANVLSDLNAPHGLAFHNGKLYVAETNAIRRYDWDEANLRAANPQLITQLPGSGNHFTRTLLFANGKMYVSVGSDCNVCVEKDERRATVMEFNDDGSAGRVFARGLRNAVGLALSPQTNTVWTTENGRDWLGDDLPPDEVNDLDPSGGNFGWPYCYGNRVPDHSQSTSYDCAATVPAKVEIQAHSAPLGLAFYTGNAFPAEYHNDLFVALHGSWNRSVPTGDKVVHIKLDAKGEPQKVEDFITGWQTSSARLSGARMGRPVGILVGPDGALYVSDDAAGVIYRVTWGR